MRVAMVCLGLLPVVISGTGCKAAEKPGPDMEEPIGKLAEISDVGFGYSTLSSGSQFLPQPDSEEIHTLVLGSPRPRKSLELDQIVRQGAVAIPALLKHLDDNRKTRIPPVKGMMWTHFIDHHDYNRRTRKLHTTELNESKLTPELESHQLTVGDLCYVALGQIMNRQFNASRYQPTGGLIVASPTHSRRLCEEVRAEFKDFDGDKHKQLLRSDFEFPDYEGRRIGAYRRIAFYYPAGVETLVLKQLAVPTYDVFAVERFVREKLYREPLAYKQKELLKQFISKHGKASSDGILLQLFDDLVLQEADEEGRLHPPLKEKRDPRSLLSELYGYRRKVRSSDRPYVSTWAATERVRFLQALVHDKSTKVNEAVFELLRKSGADEDLLDACITCLKVRGYEDKIRSYMHQRRSGNR